MRLDDSGNSNDEVTRKNNKTNKSNGSVESKLYSEAEEILMIHDRNDEEIYFLQLYSDHSIIEFTGDNAYLSEDKQTLYVEDGSDLNAYTFEDNIFGIGSIAYSSAQNDHVIILDDENNWVLNNDENYPEVKCGCYTNGGNMPNNCDAGGNNSSGCSINSGGSSCNVSCDSGSDACCSEDNNFTYD